MILKRKDILHYAIEESVNSNGQKLVTVSGLAFHSAMVVRRIDQIEMPDASIRIQVHLWLMMFGGKGSSGTFSYSLVVPDNINKITFGCEDDIIWSRDGKGIYEQAFIFP